MLNKSKINLDILDKIIIGRVEPKIYAFSTETIPNYLKVGDTYRPIEKRLNEWKKYFPDLKKQFESIAKVDNETYFRDYSVHYYLENNINKSRLKPNVIKNIPYYSNEFFKDTNKENLDNAILDIKNNFRNNNSKYQYYSFNESHNKIIHTYKRTENYEPRPNQQKTIENFNNAIKKWRTNLLMYAVMRFGKSFTSMCCAVEMKAKIVLVVSAKADVKDEWKKTVESHIKFEKYCFIDSNSLLENNSIIKENQDKNKNIVLFLTLQDLQWDEIKTKHKEIFSSEIDLLIVDETHFWARAKEYWKVLKEEKINKKEYKNELKLNDNSIDDLDNITKVINSKIRLHLSGTPYRILMNSEFTKDDIIAFYQFSDIFDDQEKWDKENLLKDEIREWDNPYYGFPQMIRFAFNPNESSRKKMEHLKKNGITYAFSELLRPKSLIKDTKNNLHKEFKHKQEILDLLNIIDWTEQDDNLLSFLDYDKLKEGKMCNHIVCVLPYRASCDAFEKLIIENKFKNLSSYKIINISWVENEKKYKNISFVQNEIKEFENKNIKTITLTVNRMLTGTTVPQWDTMLYFKETTSPQEYDQAIFRLQNQFIKVFKEPNGDVVKYNMKPQTLLVDFNPNRMFHMQEQKAQIYNVNVQSNGNINLEDRIKKELEISPIITLNKNKIVQVEPSDILNAVREYSSNRSVFDEATTISIDYWLLDIEEIKAEIEKQWKIGSKQWIEIKASKGEGDEIDVEEKEWGNEEWTEKKSNISEEEKEKDYKWQFAMYYARILFFAFLTDSNLKSLNEIIHQIDSNNDNFRIASNLNLDKKILQLFEKHINPFILSELDYKIYNINSLANDLSITPIDRASNAMKKFSRLSDSEIITPELVADKVIDSIPESEINNSTKFLDIATKQWEFVYAIYKKFGKNIANNFYSIPTSKIAYEFTRKVYKFLELDISNIEEKYTSYNLIEEKEIIKNNNITINNKTMKFDIIIGNPPYQESDWWGWLGSSAKPIYQKFVNIAKELDPTYISIIMPTRWYAWGKGLDDFRDEMLNDIHIVELHDFLKPDLIFPNINLRWWICYFLWNKKYNNKKDWTKVFTYNETLIPQINIRDLKIEDFNIFIRHKIAVDIFKKVKSNKDFISFSNYVSSRKPFWLDSKFNRSNDFNETKKGLKKPLICYAKRQSIGYVDWSKFDFDNDRLNSYKVFTSFANNIGTELNDDNLNTFIWKPKTICTETYIILWDKLNLNLSSSNNLRKYFKTKFARFLHSILKSNQNATSKTYKFVPLQDFTSESDIDWSKSIKEIDNQLYKKYNLTNEEIEFIESMIKEMK